MLASAAPAGDGINVGEARLIQSLTDRGVASWRRPPSSCSASFRLPSADRRVTDTHVDAQAGVFVTGDVSSDARDARLGRLRHG